ncbi:MAG: tetratricopeptide repeat protein [Chloroflexota bacterium]
MTKKTAFFGWLMGRDKEENWGDLYKQGEKYLSERKLQKSLEQFERSLEVARKIGDRMVEGYQQKMLGAVSGEIGKEQDDINYLNKAIEHSEKAIEIAHEIDDKGLEGSVLSILGNIYMARKDMHSMSSMVGTEEKPMMRISGDGIQKFVGDNMLATECYEKSVAVFREIGDADNTANSLFLMAISLKEMGQSDRALLAVREASQIWKKTGSHMAQYADKFLLQLQSKN